MSNHPRNAKKPISVIETLLNFVRGSLIGIAEVIPGISGGTIALITGVYKRVIDSAAEAVRGIVYSLVSPNQTWQNPLPTSKQFLGHFLSRC